MAAQNPFAAFFAELRRRRVFRVAAAYLVVAWLLIEVSSTVAEPLRLPTWVPTLVIVLVGLGFPVALLLAWAFDVTPAGVERTAPAPDRPRSGHTQLVAGVALGMLVVLVGVGAYATLVDRRHGATDGTAPGRAIVVLPFDDMSDSTGSGAFANGMTEEITSALAGVADLSVKSRTSAERYAGGTATVAEIARALGVDVVLEGSVRRAGDQVRVTAQLIDARTDEHLWAENYDRVLTPDALFQIQDDIARRIVERLRASLAPGEAERLARRPTQDLEAYELYAQALALGSDAAATRDATFDRVLDLLRRAVALDPGFAEAQAMLADVSLVYGQVYGDATWLDSARVHAERAFRADSLAPEAWYARAQVALALGDPAAAVEAGTRAVELRPSYASALGLVGTAYANMGEPRLVVRYMRRAYRLEPTNAQYAVLMARALTDVGAWDYAQRWLDRARSDAAIVALPPNRSLAAHIQLERGDTAGAEATLHAVLEPSARDRFGSLPLYWDLVGDLELRLGHEDSALAHYRRERELVGDGAGLTFTGLALIARRKGFDDEADSALRASERAGRVMAERGDAVGELTLARVAAIRGERQAAVDHLQRARDDGFTVYYGLASDPRFDSLRGFEPFDRLSAEMKAWTERARERVLAEI